MNFAINKLLLTGVTEEVIERNYLAFKPFLEESAVLLSTTTTTNSTFMPPSPSTPAAEEDEDPRSDSELEPEPEPANVEPEPKPEQNIFDSLGVSLQELTNPGLEMPALHDYWNLQQPMHSTGDCCLTLAQNFEALVLGVNVQNKSVTHPAKVFGLFDSKSLLSLEMEGASTTCLKISLNEEEFPIQSGVENGVHLLLDLETFDNAHLGADGDGLKILVADNNDFSMLDLNGFTVKPGIASTIKIRPVLFDATDDALQNFNDEERRCIDPNNPVVQNILPGVSLPYSLSNCLLGAALEQAFDNCPGLGNKSRDSLMNATGLTLGCLNRHISQVGRWKRVIASDVTCHDSCTRQENKIFVSERTFPNKMFPSSADFYLVIRTLWWSCQPEKNKFGPKRSILEKDFPDLCPYYDNFIYQNRMVNNLLSNPDYLLNRPMITFLKDFNMTVVELENFKQEILKYSRTWSRNCLYREGLCSSVQDRPGWF